MPRVARRPRPPDAEIAASQPERGRQPLRRGRERRVQVTAASSSQAPSRGEVGLAAAFSCTSRARARADSASDDATTATTRNTPSGQPSCALGIVSRPVGGR